MPWDRIGPLPVFFVIFTYIMFTKNMKKIQVGFNCWVTKTRSSIYIYLPSFYNFIKDTCLCSSIFTLFLL